MAFIQSSYGTPNAPGNFEAVIFKPGQGLVHCYRNNTQGQKWQSTAVVSSLATGPGCIIQSSFGTPNAPGNFEAVVLEGKNLVHYYRDNSPTGQQKWHSTAVITSSATGPGTIIQSSYGTPNKPGNFEVIVPEGDHYVHYYRDNGTSGFPWHKSVNID
jgi:hypothetical protein